MFFFGFMEFFRRLLKKDTSVESLSPFHWISCSDILGLQFTTELISPLYEMYLIRRIDRQGWDSTILNRRIQEYGYKYDYFARQITNKLTPLPPFAITLCQMLLEKKVIQDMPNQLIINEYKHNQGFSKHVDSWDFDPVIFTLSLGSSCSIIFRQDQKVHSFEFLPRTLLKLEQEARYSWSHEISPLEGKVHSVRRISLTFRKVSEDPCTNVSKLHAPNLT